MKMKTEIPTGCTFVTEKGKKGERKKVRGRE
jgi:hypothetical protein